MREELEKRIEAIDTWLAESRFLMTLAKCLVEVSPKEAVAEHFLKFWTDAETQHREERELLVAKMEADDERGTQETPHMDEGGNG